MSETVNLGGAVVGAGRPCYVVAELGINGNGEVDTYKRLIDVAAECGADAVKTQKRTIDLVYDADFLAQPREHPLSDDQTQRGQKEALELSIAEHVELAEYARGLGLDYTASCWDVESLRDFVEAVDPPWLKIASPLITDEALLWAHGATGKPLVVSTGMSTAEEVDHAVRLLMYKQGGATRTKGADLVLLACCSAYPADNADLNLRSIPWLAKRYGVPAGYSGHERGVVPSVAAVVMGACMVERHLTLDRASYGSDQAASLEPKGFRQLVRDIRAVEEAIGEGDGTPVVVPQEVPIREKLRGVG